MAEEQATLNSLATKVTELSETFTKCLKENKVPFPTFAADSPVKYGTLPGEAYLIRQKLLDALNDMFWLAQGPSESIFNYCHNVFSHLLKLKSENTNFSRLCPTLLVLMC